MTIEGYGPYDIARILYDDKIDTPAVTSVSRISVFGKAKRNFPIPIIGVALLSDRFYPSLNIWAIRSTSALISSPIRIRHL